MPYGSASSADALKTGGRINRLQSVMNHAWPSVCLVMIVKNEEAVIARCLDSVKSLIAYWVVCDTGSTDATRSIVRSALQHIPGELHEDTWVDFSENRNLGLTRARGKADYHLLIDADMVLNVNGLLPELGEDAYYLRFTGPCDYSVIRLISDRHAWRYRGVTHEYLSAPTAAPAVKLAQLSISHFEDGGGRAEKYSRDIRLLEKALAESSDQPRYVYYLAQSYRDVGNYEKALRWYETRVLMAGWVEETWHALYQVGKMQALLGMRLESDLELVPSGLQF